MTWFSNQIIFKPSQDKIPYTTTLLQVEDLDWAIPYSLAVTGGIIVIFFSSA